VRSLLPKYLLRAQSNPVPNIRLRDLPWLVGADCMRPQDSNSIVFDSRNRVLRCASRPVISLVEGLEPARAVVGADCIRPQYSNSIVLTRRNRASTHANSKHDQLRRAE
jgi:hypothetical protein